VCECFKEALWNHASIELSKGDKYQRHTPISPVLIGDRHTTWHGFPRARDLKRF